MVIVLSNYGPHSLWSACTHLITLQSMTALLSYRQFYVNGWVTKFVSPTYDYMIFNVLLLCIVL